MDDSTPDNIKQILNKKRVEEAVEAQNKKRQEKKELERKVSVKEQNEGGSSESGGDPPSSCRPEKESFTSVPDSGKNAPISSGQSEEMQEFPPLGGDKKEAKDITSAKSTVEPIAQKESKSKSEDTTELDNETQSATDESTYTQEQSKELFAEEKSQPNSDYTSRPEGDTKEAGVDAMEQHGDPIAEEAPKPESKTEKKIPDLKLRLPNVKQGVRSPGLEIKRSQDTDGIKHRWEKCYVDLEADVTEEELGIDYDLESGLLHVTPSKHGDFIIWFRREENGYPKLACRLTVIPDPKTLWTASDPAEDAPYPKEHKDSKFLLAGKRIMAGASVRGRSHARDGTHRDDDFLVCELVDGWNLMVVADGAGSAKFSRKGSEILVETMYSFISEKLGGTETLEKLNTEASEAIHDDSSINRAKNLLVLGAYSSLMRIQEEAKSKVAKTKDFNTTIISCLFKEFGDKTFIYSFCIGDGALFVVEVDSKKIFSLNAADSGEFAGQTRFLTTPEVWQDHGVYERVKFATIGGPLLIIGMTDGVSDPLLPDVDEIEEYAQIETLLNGLEGDDSVDGLLDVLRKTVEKNDAIDLDEWLDFYVAKHHDDRSIAVAFDPQFLS